MFICKIQKKPFYNYLFTFYTTWSIERLLSDVMFVIISEPEPRVEFCQTRILHSLYCHFIQMKNARPGRIRLAAVRKWSFLTWILLVWALLIAVSIILQVYLILHPRSLACDNLPGIVLAINIWQHFCHCYPFCIVTRSKRKPAELWAMNFIINLV